MRSLLLLFLLAFSTAGCPPVDSEDPPEEEEVLPPSPIVWEVCSQIVGDHPCNLTLLDQNGDVFDLYEHYGDFIVLDFSTMWCGPCQRAGAESQATHDFYKNLLVPEENFVYVTVIIENLDRDPPTPEDIQDWVTYFNVTTAPVLLGSRDLLGEETVAWPLTGWPTFYFIDDELVLQNIVRGYSEESLNYFIEELLNLEL